MKGTERDNSLEDAGLEAAGEVAPSNDSEIAEKQPFTEPKLAYLTPKLVKQGGIVALTGFFGTFSP